MSLQEVLASMQDVELTDDETARALIKAKQEKRQSLDDAARRERAEINRKALTNSQWDSKQTEAFMLYRAGQMFEGKRNPDGSPQRFVLDAQNRAVFDLLCQYFSNDIDFMPQATNMQIAKPSLGKGLILLGNCGTGKTLLMRLFQKNKRQVFRLANVKDIADEFSTDGAESRHVEKVKNPVNDAESFYQPFTGLCLDDLGTEDVKMHYGNRKNVIGDLIEKRYSRQNTGVFLHATTNMNLQQVTDFYGARVLSRMYEIFNFIELPGDDRRK